MMYFYRVVYFLVILWIQGGETQLISIWAYPTTVSQGEKFAITCQTVYPNIGFKRNNNMIIQTSYGKCDIPTPDTQKYKCELKRNGMEYIITLKVLRGESSPQTVQWSCVYPNDNRIQSDVVNITVRNSDQSTITAQTTLSPYRSTKSLVTGAPSGQQPVSSLSPDQPPVSSLPLDQSTAPCSNNVCKQPNNFNVISIALNCVVGVLVLIHILISVMFQNKRKRGAAIQESSRPLALEPRRSPGEGNYDDLDRSMVDGHTYDTAQASGVQP